ncbi:hypothetical protein [Enterococcus alishanensis]
MQKVRKIVSAAVGTTPFLLSNLITIIPYFMYIHLLNGRQVISVLPFVLFYTFRMTGIFLLKGLKEPIEKYTLMIVALLIGSLGSIFSLLGEVYPTFYLIGGIGLGLCAAWLPPANVSVHFYEKKQGQAKMPNWQYLLVLLLLIPLFWGLTLPLSKQMLIVPAVLTIYFIAAYYGIRRHPDYQLDFKHLSRQMFSLREFIYFALFFVILFLLRSGRLMFNEFYLNIAILGFTLLFLTLIFSLQRKYQQWVLPLWQNLITFLNGIFGNFIILFGSFYVSAVYGRAQLVYMLFIPYAVGMILASLFGEKVRRKTNKSLHSQLFGLGIGLLLMLIPSFFSLGIFVLTFFQKSINQWLNQLYDESDKIPASRKFTAKYATANLGSIFHQFMMMVGMTLVLYLRHDPLQSILLYQQQPVDFVAVMTIIKQVSIICLLIALIIVERIEKHAVNH